MLDEAHLFEPQSGAGAGNFETIALLHATNNLVSLGRSAGLRIMMITQRTGEAPQGQRESGRVHGRAPSRRSPAIARLSRIGSTVPRTRAAGTEIMASLANLPTGTGWIYAPEIGVLERSAFPSIATGRWRPVRCRS